MNVLDTPPADYDPRKEAWAQPPTPAAPEDSRPMARASEPITVNRALIWATGIIGTVFTIGTVAMVTSLLAMRDGQTEMRAGLLSLKETVTELKTQVSVGTQSRYTSVEAASDRASILQTFNTTREAWSLSFKGVIDANTKLAGDVADLRVEVATLKARSKP